MELFKVLQGQDTNLVNKLGVGLKMPINSSIILTHSV